jgi:hypothetical protein
VAARFDVAKVLVGAFAVPWWHRRSFARALAVPLASLAALSLGWYYLAKQVPTFVGWLACAAYGALFAWFAVTCHRLVLLDAQAVAARLVPRWSWREVRFMFWMTGAWLIFMIVMLVTATAAMNLVPGVRGRPELWSDWIEPLSRIPAYYVFARLSLMFPAVALDRPVSLGWSWRLTKRNGWRVFIVVAILPWIISELVALLYRGDATAAETVVLTFLGTALFAVEIAALSLSYRELTKDEAVP